VRLYSRPGNDLTRRFPLIVDALARLRSRSCIIDGEAVPCDDNGVATRVTKRTDRMSVRPFKSDEDVEKFAREFLKEHDQRFSKDVAICLRPDKNGSHAYFPAVITCIAFAELLSGLHAGNLKGDGLKKLKDYAFDFMDRTIYDADRLEILYVMFRHKVAHLAQPYAVTKTKPAFQGQPKRLITWTVEESGAKPAIEIVPETSPQQILKAVTPWPVYYDHRAYVRIESLASDIRESVPKYLERLQTDKSACANFRKCMKHFFPC
jgi:hypothetical protein